MSKYPARQFKRPPGQHPHSLNMQPMAAASGDTSSQMTSEVGKRRGEFLLTPSLPVPSQSASDVPDVPAQVKAKTPVVMPTPVQNCDEMVIPPKLTLKLQGLLRVKAE